VRTRVAAALSAAAAPAVQGSAPHQPRLPFQHLECSK
jgi:hypothetical protein